MCVSCFIPVEPASWSSWSSWTTCSQTCNGGTRSRSRTCEGGSTCPGDNYQQQICNTRSCPVAASWSSWGSWGGCSVTCGGGRQARIRLCRNGNACAGASTQFRDCNEQTCPGMNSHLMLCTVQFPDSILPHHTVLPGTWSSWSLWSECSSSCDGGRQTRQRQCLSEPCEGQSSETRSCNPHQCE